MEPVTMVAGVLGKILVAGLTAHLGARNAGFDADDLAALEKLLELGVGAAGALRGAGGPGSASMEALHFALVTRAFGAALRDHWHDDARLAPVLEKAPWLRAFFRPKDQRERRQEAQARLAFALTTLKKLRDEAPDDALGRVRAVVEDPLTTPYYRALWLAFTHPTLNEADQAPLVMFEREEDKHAFEGAFQLTHAEEMAGSAAEKLRNHLVALKDSEPRILRRLLLQDMATWDRQHVFGDAETPGIPLLPRGEIYVEPYAVLGGRPFEGLRKPAQELISDLLQKHEVVIVRGDFGLGKSMTARLMACRLAKDYLTNRSLTSSELPFPVFIKCSRDIRLRELELRASARRAFFEHARERRISIQKSHSALALSELPERVLYFVDGLDEVQWSGRELEDFFHSLKEQTDIRQQAVVFSRMAVVPSEEHRRGMPVIDVKPFTTQNADGTAGGQVSAWLERWNRLDLDIRDEKKAAVTADKLEKNRLLGICETPIVLLMAAATWQGTDAQETVSRARVYERFMLQVARGKYEYDQEHHPVVAKAADTLKRHLVDKDEMKESESPPEAMLWLMARAAWEGQRLARKDKELTVRHVENLLAEELDVDDPTNTELIKMGLLLVLQAELTTGNHRITYQHKSFREFLVARYWASTLWRIAEPGSDRKELEDRLLGARLFAPEDESFDFLQQILNAPPWDDTRRSALRHWADVRFHDEIPAYGAREKQSWSTDQVPALREAALAIAGSLEIGGQASCGIEVRNPEALRTLVAWYWLQPFGQGLQAPRVQVEGIDLIGASLMDSNLAEASLLNASLTGADLMGANLFCTSLTGASLATASLTGANLEGADLEGANLERANLRRANLGRANLRGANLRRADLEGADLEGANLEGASLGGANLEGANLEGANLEGANYAPDVFLSLFDEEPIQVEEDAGEEDSDRLDD